MYVNGLIVALLYYVSVGIGRNWLLGIRQPSVFRRYLAIGLMSLLAVLASAKWF